MKAAALFLLLSAALVAQHRGSARAGGGVWSGIPSTTSWGSPSGFGNVLFPGTGHMPGTPGSPGINATHPIRGGRGASGVVWVPWAYPVYSDPSPQVIVVQQPAAPAQPPTQVIINQNFVPETARPVIRDYSFDNPASPDGVRSQETARSRESDERKPYLIALRDHTIYAAFTYWLEGDTLHYVTTHGTHNQVSLNLVDHDFSDRLNRDRGVSFTLK